MFDGRMELEVGDLIEIKYRVASLNYGRDRTSDLIDRWVAAEIVHSEADSLPVARLRDGQFTDIRKYMTWRRLPRA
jgi:hypothetical protein